MEIEIHPKIWGHVLKMYDCYYKENTEIKKVLLSLQLTSDVRNVNRYNLEGFLKSLSFHDGIKVIRDILMTYDDDLNNQLEKLQKFSAVSMSLGLGFEKMMCENQIREIVNKLINSLKENGLEYDRVTRTSSRVTDDEKIIILTSKRQVDRLIDLQFNENFYDYLKDEINIAYRDGLFTSVSLLCRKLIEELVYEILRLKYPAKGQSRLKIYYNKQEKRHHDFTILLKNLEDRKAKYGVDEDIISEFISLVKPFRPKANADAHSIIIIRNEQDILDYKIPKMISLLKKLRDTLERESKV